MAWSTPKTWTAGSGVTAAEFNQEIRDNLQALRDERVTGGYEEGTWTPGISFGGASDGIAYSVQNGQYVKVGLLVYASFQISLTSKGTSTGTARVTGLPFTSHGATPNGGNVITSYGNTSHGSGTLALAVEAGATTAIIRSLAGNANDLNEINLNNSTYLIAGFVYRAA